jgi:hypothetical protein
MGRRQAQLTAETQSRGDRRGEELEMKKELAMGGNYEKVFSAFLSPRLRVYAVS